MIDFTNQALLFGAALLFGGILAGWWSGRLGLPVLAVFLAVGMLAGEDGPGGYEFDNVEASFLVGNLALAVILLDGGLRTRYATFRVGLGPALVLASFGVALTAALVGAFGMAVFGFDWRYGLLLGAIVGSTDAAAVFAILRASGSRLNDRLAAVLELESGLNDPMAVFLTLTLLALVLSGSAAPDASTAVTILRQFGLGVVLGVAGGAALGRILARVHLTTGLQALLVTAGGVMIFAVTNVMGGSGFLAVYLVGLLAGNHRNAVRDEVLQAMDGLAWLAQAAMFLLLGLLVTPSELGRIAWPGLALAVWLMLVARPAAVAASLAFFGFSRREVLFVGWVGLRGAVPIVLALFPLMAGIEGARDLFNLAFFVVLVSLALQGSTVALAARRFGVHVPPLPEPLTRVHVQSASAEHWDFAQFEVASGSAADGAAPASLQLPAGTHLAMTFREGVGLTPPAPDSFRAGDLACVLAPTHAVGRLCELFGSAPSDATAAAWPGQVEFIVDGSTPLEAIADFYAIPIESADPAQTLDAYISRRLNDRPVVGDTVEAGRLRLTVRAMEGRRVTRVAIGLP